MSLISGGDEDSLSEKPSKGWFARHAATEAKKDALSSSERAGQAMAVLGSLLVLSFFVANQTMSTGLFTSKFGPAEALLFYAPALIGIVASASRGATGRKNTVRPLDTSELGLIIPALIWLFAVFPFDFSHLGDLLPNFLRFLVAWISNDVAKLLMGIGIVATPIGTIYTAALYLFVRRELRS